MKSLIAVYQKFKHMDLLLSDKERLGYDDPSPDNIHKCCHELWMALKAAGVSDMPTDTPFIDLGENAACNSCGKRFCTCYDRISGRMTGQYPEVIDPRERTNDEHKQ